MECDYDEDDLTDIGAIYDLGKGGLGENFSLSSPEMTEIIRRAFEEVSGKLVESTKRQEFQW